MAEYLVHEELDAAGQRGAAAQPRVQREHRRVGILRHAARRRKHRRQERRGGCWSVAGWLRAAQLQGAQWQQRATGAPEGGEVLAALLVQVLVHRPSALGVRRKLLPLEQLDGQPHRGGAVLDASDEGGAGALTQASQQEERAGADVQAAPAPRDAADGLGVGAAAHGVGRHRGVVADGVIHVLVVHATAPPRHLPQVPPRLVGWRVQVCQAHAVTDTASLSSDTVPATVIPPFPRFLQPVLLGLHVAG